MPAQQTWLAHTVGWIAQLDKVIDDTGYEIGRPRQLFVGVGYQQWVPVAQG